MKDFIIYTKQGVNLITKVMLMVYIENQIQSKYFVMKHLIRNSSFNLNQILLLCHLPKAKTNQNQAFNTIN